MVKVDISQLIVFITVVEEGSISKAARRLNYGQSTVTNKIKQLEDTMNNSLFYRSSLGVTLTPMGDVFITYAREIVNVANDAETALMGEDNYNKDINLGCIDVLASSSISSFIINSFRKLKNLDIHLEIGLSQDLLQAVVDRNLEAAIIDGPVDHECVQEEFRFYDYIGVVSHKDFPIESWSDLASKKVFLLNIECIYRRKLDFFLTNLGLSCPKYIKMGSLDSILDCITSQLGIGVLPKKYFDKIQPIYKDLRFKQFPLSYSEVYNVLITRKNNENPHLKKVIPLIENTLLDSLTS